MSARSEDSRIDTVTRRLSFIRRKWTWSRRRGGCDHCIASSFRWRSRDVNICRRRAVAGSTLRNFRPRGRTRMSRRTGGEFPRAIAFGNNQRSARRDGLGVEYQHLTKSFLSRGVSTCHRRRGRYGCRLLCGQSKIAQVSASRRWSRSRNLRRGHRQGD